MKNLYSRLTLITSALLVTGYLIVSATWVPMTGDATTGTQFTATIWNNLVGNVNDLDSRIGGVISSQWTSSGTTAYYTGGNVGIGTANPTDTANFGRALDIQSNGGAATYYRASGTNPSSQYFAVGYSPTAAYLVQANNAPIVFYTNNTEKMRLDATGNVGIGTTNPWEMVSIAGGSGASLKLSISNLTPSTGHKWTLNSASTGNFYLGDDTAGANRIAVDTAGNVGIGTPSPNRLLHLKTTTGTNAEFDIQSGTKPLWGIYHDETSEELRFWNGANRVVFGSGGNVGIGTTAPATRLVVDETTAGDSRTIGTFQTTSAGRTPRLDFKSSGVEGGTQAMILQTGSPLAAYPGLSLQPSGGNVGIGTVSPTAKLEVNGAANLYTAIFQSSLTSGQAYGPAIRAGTNSSDTAFVVNDATNANPLFRVRWDGNVGIGTTSPEAKLHIESVTRTTPANQPLVLTSPTTAIGDKLGISFSQTDNYSRARAGIYAISELANGYASSLGFFTRNAEDGTQLDNADEKMRITSDGRVGIGTTNPWSRLTLVANPQTTKPLYIQAIDDNNGPTKTPLDWSYVPGIVISNDWSGNAATVNSTKIAKIVLNTAAGGYNNGASIHVEGAGGYDQGQLIFSTWWNSSSLATERMRINTLGYVWIWVSSPTYRLQLPNTASAAGQWQANAWATYSDGRVKTEKENLRYGISEIMKIDPKQYVHHSSEFQSGSLVVTSEWIHTIGFIAQELEKIIPEAVNKPSDDSKELWSIDYNKLVPILVNATKELKKENDSLKSLVCLDHPSAEICQ